MANITTCTRCGKCHEAGSDEQANEAVRQCPTCRRHIRDMMRCHLAPSPPLPDIPGTTRIDDYYFIHPGTDPLAVAEEIRRLQPQTDPSKPVVPTKDLSYYVAMIGRGRKAEDANR